MGLVHLLLFMSVIFFTAFVLSDIRVIENHGQSRKHLQVTVCYRLKAE